MNINKITVDSKTHTLRPYGTCDTAAGTTAKVVSCSDFTLFTNATVIVKFSNANTASAPTLNVNNTGAKTITGFESSSVLSGLCEFMYDGTNWCLLSTTKTGGNLPTDIDYKNLNSTEYVVAAADIDERFDDVIALHPQQICIGSPQGLGVAPIANTSTPESTSKPIQETAGFLPEDIFIYTGTEVLSASELIPAGTLQSSGYTDRADYTFNTTLPAFHEVFLVCFAWDLVNGSYILNSDSTTSWYKFLDSNRINTVIPDDAGFEEYTSPDSSNVYIKIGRSGSVENRMELYKEKKVYIYKDHRLHNIDLESYINSLSSKTRLNSVEYKTYVIHSSNTPASISYYQLCASYFTDGYIVPLIKESGTGTSKPAASWGINPKKIFFSKKSYSANSVIAKESLVSSGSIGARAKYSFNSDLPAYHEVYLKGTYVPSRGFFQLDTTSTTSWYVFVDSSILNASSPDVNTWRSKFVKGAYYINIGHSGATANDLELYEEKPLLYFDGLFLVDGYTAGLGSTSGGSTTTEMTPIPLNKNVDYSAFNYDIYQYRLCASFLNDSVVALVEGDPQNGVSDTSKAPFSSLFNPEDIFYYSGSSTVSAGTNIPANTLYSTYYIPETRYTFNSTLSAGYEVFLVGTYNSSNNAFQLDTSNSTSWYLFVDPTETWPLYRQNFTAGKYYIKIGRAGRTANTMQLYEKKQLLYFNGSWLLNGYTAGLSGSAAATNQVVTASSVDSIDTSTLKEGDVALIV